jgi:hypothetical protein
MDRDIPPDPELCHGWDPDDDSPPDLDGLPLEAPAESVSAAGPVRVAEALPPGVLPRDGSGGGPGFADGGVLDVLAPGVVLAGFADAAHARLGGVSDDELIGVLRAWRRQVSWAQARELAAMAELARRRPAAGTPPAPSAPRGGPRPFPGQLSEFIADEIAPALTLTRITADADLGLALDLARRLPRTAAALEAGEIDLARVKVIATGTSTLTDEHAAAVEDAVLPDAGQQTTGQLRAAVTRAVLAVDSAATRKRREDAEKCARVECWTDPAGTATLAGRHLPAAETLAADRRVCRIARGWKKQAAAGGMDLLRARAYLALLLGHDTTTPPPELLPATGNSPTPGSQTAPGSDSAPDSGCTGHDGEDCDPSDGDQDHLGTAVGGLAAQPVRAGLRTPGAGGGDGLPLAGTINLTVPLTTLLGLSSSPGDAAGYGPLDPDATRALACAAAGHHATRWHLTITSPDSQAIGHGRAAARETIPGDGDGGWSVTVTTEPLATGTCEHRTREPGYRPTPALQRLIRARSTTCTARGCRRPAQRCDLDHTIPHGQDGLTCECNLAPLCRHHHRVKQAEGWKLEQTSPGSMIWATPAGRRYTTLPSKHPT